MISQWKINKLIKLGEDFKCPFHLPPLNKNINEAFFDINEFKETPSFQDFLTHINSLEIAFEYAKHNDKIYLVIEL